MTVVKYLCFFLPLAPFPISAEIYVYKCDGSQLVDVGFTMSVNRTKDCFHRARDITFHAWVDFFPEKESLMPLNDWLQLDQQYHDLRSFLSGHKGSRLSLNYYNDTNVERIKGVRYGEMDVYTADSSSNQSDSLIDLVLFGIYRLLNIEVERGICLWIPFFDFSCFRKNYCCGDVHDEHVEMGVSDQLIASKSTTEEDYEVSFSLKKEYDIKLKLRVYEKQGEGGRTQVNSNKITKKAEIDSPAQEQAIAKEPILLSSKDIGVILYQVKI